MNALANLKHQETMLNLDCAIHEAQKKRYANIASSASSLPANLPGNLPFGRSTSTALNPMLSPLNRQLFQVGSLARQLSLGSGSPLGGNLGDQTALPASFLPLARLQRMNSNPASIQQPSEETKSAGSPAKQPAEKGDEQRKDS